MSKSPIYKSFAYAFKGISFAWKERNFKLHVLSMCLAIAAGFYFEISKTDWCLVLLCIGGVMSLEVMNTALERTVDRISLERHPELGKIKDLSAAAVLLFSIAALVIGLLIFVPYVNEAFFENVRHCH